MAADLAPSTRVRRARAVLWREGEFGVVVLAPGLDEPQTLTGTGRALWHALAQPHSGTEIASELAVMFSAEPDRVLADILPVLVELERVGAVERDVE